MVRTAPAPCPTRIRTAALWITLSLFGLAVTATAQIPRGDRLLGIDVNAAEDGDFFAAFSLAESAGLQVATLHLGWDDIESAPGVFGNEFLDAANTFYPIVGASVSLTLTPIDTNTLRLPADLANLPFDDPRVVARFNALLDYVFSRIGDLELTSLAIGNEIDAIAAPGSAIYSQYETFFAQTSVHARSLRPGLTVGATSTLYGLIGAHAEALAGINAHSDWILATYYPLDSKFQVKPPSALDLEIGSLLDRYAGRPVALLEAGLPSGAGNGSSLDLQAEFVRQLFQVWDAHAEQIPLIAISWLHDISPEAVATFVEYYGLDDPAFAEYLGTLGVRTHGGNDKPAFRELRAQAAVRGWDVDGAASGCTADDTTLCLQGERFRVTVEWRDFEDRQGAGQVVGAGSGDSGLMWFFNPDNWEMLIKVLDGCSINGHFWVLAAATTNVEYQLRVLDTATGSERTYSNALGVSSPAVVDNRAFAACP